MSTELIARQFGYQGRDGYSNEEWVKLEGELQVVFPDDFKEFVDFFGNCKFFGYIEVINPFKGVGGTDYKTHCEKYFSLLQMIRSRNTVGYCNILLDKPWHNLLLCIDDNKGNIWWDSLNRQIIVTDSHFSSNFNRFDINFTGFMYKWATGALDVPFYPEDAKDMDIAMEIL